MITSALRDRVRMVLESCLRGSMPSSDKCSEQLEDAVFHAYGGNEVDYETAIRFIADYCTTHDFDGLNVSTRRTRARKTKKKSVKAVVNMALEAYACNSMSSSEAKFRENVDGDVEKLETAMHLIRQIGTESGVTVTCLRCRGSQVGVTMQQLRSMDEGMTSIYSCGECGATWRD